MSVGTTWQNLQNECDALKEESTLLTPLSGTEFTITSVQDPRIVIEYRDNGDSEPLQRDQFETLIRRAEDAGAGFALDRLPPDADPYAAVLSLHPRFEIDEQDGVIRDTDDPTGSQLVPGSADESDKDERSEPTRPEYADLLLLVDTMERHDVDIYDGDATTADADDSTER